MKKRRLKVGRVMLALALTGAVGKLAHHMGSSLSSSTGVATPPASSREPQTRMTTIHILTNDNNTLVKLTEKLKNRFQVLGTSNPTAPEGHYLVTTIGQGRRLARECSRCGVTIPVHERSGQTEPALIFNGPTSKETL